MNWKRVAAVVGLGLLFLGLGLAFLLWNEGQQARGLDQLRPVTGGPNRPVDCSDMVTVEARLNRRVMAENETQALLVTLDNAGSTLCEMAVELSAPRFTIVPATSRQTVSVPAGSTADVSWVISPLLVGAHELVVTAGGQAIVLGITTTNILGLTARQAQIASVLATFLGPMLSAPWWYERWQEWRKQQARRKQKAASNDKQAQGQESQSLDREP